MNFLAYEAIFFFQSLSYIFFLLEGTRARRQLNPQAKQLPSKKGNSDVSGQFRNSRGCPIPMDADYQRPVTKTMGHVLPHL